MVVQVADCVVLSMAEAKYVATKEVCLELSAKAFFEKSTLENDRYKFLAMTRVMFG